MRGDETVTLWGTGTPRRDLLYSDDMAEACILLLFGAQDAGTTLVNIGSGTDVTILELAELVREVVSCDATILWDQTKPDGTPRKLLDISVATRVGWRPTVGLREGIGLALADFASRSGR